MYGEEVIRDDMSDCSRVSCKSSTSGVSTASGFSKVRHPSITCHSVTDLRKPHYRSNACHPILPSNGKL